MHWIDNRTIDNYFAEAGQRLLRLRDYCQSVALLSLTSKHV